MTDIVHGLGVLGTGIMGRRMLTALQQATRFRVAALYEPQADALQAALALAPGARAATGLDDLVGDPAVQLVYIATPPALHLAGVRAALAAGRACLCEKPLAADRAQALALRDAVVAAGLPVAVNFPFASSSSARRLVDIVRSGDLGALQSARIHLRFAQWPRPWQSGASPWLAGQHAARPGRAAGRPARSPAGQRRRGGRRRAMHRAPAGGLISATARFQAAQARAAPRITSAEAILPRPASPSSAHSIEAQRTMPARSIMNKAFSCGHCRSTSPWSTALVT